MGKRYSQTIQLADIKQSTVLDPVKLVISYMIKTE